MFELTKNEFLQNNKCWYMDEFNNSAFMKRTEEGITAKIRFNDKRIVAEPMYIKIPQDENKQGDNIRLHYTDETILELPLVKKGLENFTSLINYWICMILDIKGLDISNALLKKANPDATEEDIAQHKLSMIAPYKELENIVNLIK